MSLPPPESPTLDQTEEEQAAIKALIDKYAKSNLHDAEEDPAKIGQKDLMEPRPMRVYTCKQLLHLSRSHLVQVPPHMPELKQWFGDNEISLSKKESDPSSNGRARFRRDLDEGDASSRPPFRSTLTQPSQMGNFKHQSLRSGDRDRERDGDRDREIRDKEGLRHLSEKYDRDRFGMLPTGARGKERESASHLNSGSSNRTSSQNQSSSGNRRAEGRDSQKKRPGETGDDWRRNEPSRNSRDDRNDRERPRSRARESSRSRRSPSRPRREREDGRDRPSRSDRDDHRREEYRRERDADRIPDDDPRHWRDDGKRDERMAVRRTPRERGDHWEPSNDRRWTSGEERDGRDKRTSGRDKKSGGNRDELRDREDKREREREREKEPAWMETYVPTSTSGILGGKSVDGELDGIQAWKKGLKEKELQGRSLEIASEPDAPAGQEMEGKDLDEIQIFKLLMKREEQKKSDNSSFSAPDVNADTSHATAATDQTSLPTQPRPSSTANLDSPSVISPPLRDAAIKPLPSAIAVASDGSPSIPFSEKSAEYNPPAGSRLLALGRTSAKSPVNSLSGPSPGPSNGLTIETVVNPGTPRSQGFSPFEEHHHHLSEEQAQLANSGQLDLGQRALDKQYSSMPPMNTYDDSNGLAHTGNKGSRFAKFFDNKTKENVPPGLKPQTPTDFLSSSPNPPLRQEQALYGSGPPSVDDLFAMLSSSSQAQRTNLLNHPTPQHPLNSGLLLNQASAMSNLPPQPQQLQPNNRLDALYDSRLDDRFVPDGMVPGLRTVPPRSRDNVGRDNVGLYQEMPDEALQFHLQRLQQQQQRNLDSFSNTNLPMYNPQSGRNMVLPLQQAQFRGGPSPGGGPHNQLSSIQHQRLPAGLANLGGRPPHDPSQFIGSQLHPNGPLHVNLLPSAAPPQQQQFNNIAVSSLNFSSPQIRGPVPNMHQLQNVGPHPNLPHMSLGNNMDPRSQNPNQILGMGGPGHLGLRGSNPLYNPQQANHLQAPLLGGRQQPGHHLPPHVPSHLMPPHYQQGMNAPNNGHTSELIALLMGGAPRE